MQHPMHVLGGTTVGSYELQECLGYGSCTAVYRAVTGGAQFAIKLVDTTHQDDAGLVDRLRREGDVLDTIGHDGILPIQDAVREAGMTVAAMPLKQATTLHDLMVQGGLDMDLAWSILNQIAESLDLAHQRSLVYRVLKPVNVLIGEDGRAYLAEFGVTGQRIGQMALATPNFHVAAPQYLPPEQLQAGEMDHRADIYSLGVLAFELATGTPLYGSAPPAEILRATLHHAPPSASARNPGLPAEVDAVFHRALARNPILRHRSVWELLDELAAPPPLPAAPEPAPENVPEAPEDPEPPPEDRPDPPHLLGDPPGQRDLWTPPAPELVVPGEPVPDEPPPALVVLPGLDVPMLEEEQRNVLDSYLTICVRAGREVTGRYWADILAHAGLKEYMVHDPTEDHTYVPELLALSLITEGFDAVLGEDAPRYMEDWGGLVNQHWLQSIQQKPPWIAGPPTGRLVDMLSVFIEALNRVRGEEFHAWKQVGMRLFRVVHQCNMTAVGRQKESEACHFWIGAYGAALEWAGLGSSWTVSEVECGCVTGTYNCVFTIVRTDR